MFIVFSLHKHINILQLFFIVISITGRPPDPGVCDLWGEGSTQALISPADRVRLPDSGRESGLALLYHT